MARDPNLQIGLTTDIVEIGAQVTGHIQRWPSDGDDNSKKVGKVEAIRVKVRWRTEGRGDRDWETVGEVNIPASDFGQAKGSFAIPIPYDAPISYDGNLIRVLWEVEARTDRKYAVDPKFVLPLLVVPQNGGHRYRRPHPLPRAADTWTPIPGRGPAAGPQGSFPPPPVVDGVPPPPTPYSAPPPPGPPPASDPRPNDSPFAERPGYLDRSSDD